MAATSSGDSILYDLLVHAEWPLEGEILNKPGFDVGELRGSLPKKCWSVTQNCVQWALQGVNQLVSGSSMINGIPAELFSVINGGSQWRIALSSDGNLLAVLQGSCIEIRSLKDDFGSVVATCSVNKDPFPQWRKLAWSQDSSMLACSFSNGEVVVFDLAGELLFTIDQNSLGSVGLPLDLSKAVAGMVFVDHKTNALWSAELLVIKYDGRLTNYLVSPTNGCRENHRFSFSNILHQGVYCVMYQPQHQMLILGTAAETQGETFADMPSAFDCGLLAWRILTGFPYYKIIKNDHIDIQAGTDMLKRISNLALFRSTTKKDGVFFGSISPDGSKVAALHLSGLLSVWHIPSFRRTFDWGPDDQPSVEEPESGMDQFKGSRSSYLDKDIGFSGLTDINWWPSERLILAHSKGDVMVSPLQESLCNLLGQSPERCESWPLITVAHNDGFLILECEKSIQTGVPKQLSNDEMESTPLQPDDDEEDDNDDDDDDDDYDASFNHKTRQFAKQVLFFLTESERFQPAVRRTKFLYRTYRLICIRSTTPEELYARKIDLEEYGDALTLAQTYGLDCDLVYQKRWKKSKVSKASIEDYLLKVKNRLWVLNECVERIPDTLEAAKQLLEHGLHGTDALVLVTLGKGDTNIGFNISDGEHEDGKEDSMKSAEESLVFSSFNLEQRDICRYRLKLLQYLDRLSTYEVILGGTHIAHEEYSREFFQQFRDINIVQAAVEYARDGDCEALDAIFTYHGSYTLQHRLAILSNFPETKHPSDYKYLLPEAGTSPDEPEVFEWEVHPWRNTDWCEADECKKVLNWVDDQDTGDFLYHENPSLQQYSKAPLTSSMLTTWYSNRAAEIESRSQQVLHSLQLVQLGMERGIKGLELLNDDLITMETLIYQCSGNVYLGLEDFQGMDDIDKLRMVLAKSSEVCFVGDFKRWVLPFLARCEKRKPGSQKHLIHQYLTDVAKSDLTYVLKIFQNSTPELKVPIIADVAQLMKLALECVYICKRDDQVHTAFSILECLPAPDEEILSEQIGELNKQIDQLEVHLCACEILAKHNLAKPVSYVLDTEGNKKEALDLLKKMTSFTVTCSPPAKEKQWKSLLKDMFTLQEQVYMCIEKIEVYKIYTVALLHSGVKDNILLAGQMLCKSTIEERHPPSEDILAGPRIPLNSGVELVLNASKEYFNSSNDLSDAAMELARACLNLYDEPPDPVQEEFNLIGALALLDDFGVQVLPLEVRLCDDKLGLVQRALDSSPGAYKNTDKVLHLACLLEVSGQDQSLRKGRVLTILAECALNKKDFYSANSTCQQLIKEGYESAWVVCRILGECEDYRELKARQSLLAFALTHCSPDAIEPLIHSRSLVETQILYKELDQHMDKVDEENDEPVEGTDHEKPQKSLLRKMTARDWWKNTVSWIRPLHSKAHINGDSQSGEDGNEVSIHLFHPFYHSVLSDADRKIAAGLPYTEWSTNKALDSSFRLSHSLLRTQKLLESRAEGSIEEPATEVLLALARSALKYDTTEAISYLLALPNLSEANGLFRTLTNTYFCLHMAAYCFAVEIYSKLHPDLSLDQSELYCKAPDDLIHHIKSQINDGAAADRQPNLQNDCTQFMRWYNQMTDFAQAQLLQSLGRGVDISRFACDLEYKKDTILGLAMTLEENIFTTAMSLAERYDVSEWDLLIGHLEWLFSDSGLATKEIQERVNKLGIMTCLVKHPAKTCMRMIENIYPTVDGKMHARLIYYFMLLQECQDNQPELKSVPDAQTHLKILKKIKSAAPGLNYKRLIDGGSPLEVMSSVLNGTNVHLLAKLAPRIPTKNNTVLSSSGVFRVFTEKLFWEGDQKSKDTEADNGVDWIHRYEACQKFFLRLTPSDLTKLIDTITFSEKAIDTLLLETRSDIVNRSLKYVRQQDASRKKKGLEEDSSESSPRTDDDLTFEKAILHFEHSARHLESMTDGIVYALIDADEDNDTEYARQYDLSRSDPTKMNILVSQMLVDGVSITSLDELLRLASTQTLQSWSALDVVQNTLNTVLNTLSNTASQEPALFSTKKDSIEIIKTLIDAVSFHINNEGTLVTQDDVLSALRPFCADVVVPAKVKTRVLHILEGSFNLSGEDTFLLLFCQTEAIVSAQWKRELSPEDIDSDEKRHVLFLEQLEQSTSLKELLPLATLLHIWPVLAATELSEHDPEINPWIQLLMKMLLCGDDGTAFLTVMKSTKISAALGVQCSLHVFKVMLKKCPKVVAFKFGVITGYEELHRAVLDQMENSEVSQETCDDDLLEILLRNDLAAAVATTPFLKPFVQFVLDYKDKENESRDYAQQVSHQLQTAGYVVEAGTLMSHHNTVHPVLRTLDSALEALSHWLKT